MIMKSGSAKGDLGEAPDPDNLQALHWRATAARSSNLPAALIAA